MMTVSVLHSQTDTSKIWINRQDALRKLAQADSLRPYKQLVAAKQRDIDTLNARIIILGEQIKEYKGKDTAYAQMVIAKNDQIQAMKDIREIHEARIKELEKLWKREKRKRILMTVGGVVSTGLALVLYLSK